MNKILNTSNRYVMTILVSLSVWVVSIIINALAGMILIGFVSGDGELLAVLGIIIAFSAAFSLPGIIIFWLVFLYNCKKENLFIMLMLTAFLTSFISVVVFFVWLNEGFAGQSFWLITFAVLSALVAVLLHRPAINNILEKQKEKKLCTSQL